MGPQPGDAVNRQNLVAFYEADLKRYGPEDARSLHWVSQRTQWSRFEVLYQVGPWDGMAVADVGCGLGDLVGFLTAKGHQVKPGPGPAHDQTPPAPGRGAIHYNGYDVTPAMVQAARRKYPQGAFHLRDILQQGFVGRPDYVIASGTFNIRLDDHERWLKEMIGSMYQACRRAVAFNFLGLPDSLSPEDAGGAASQQGGSEAVQPGWEPLARWTTIYYEAPPQSVLGWCRDLSPRVEMTGGYLPGDYTVFLYRD